MKDFFYFAYSLENFQKKIYDISKIKFKARQADHKKSLNH